MDSTARIPHNPAARLTGIGIACAVHVALIVAVSQGLMHAPTPKPAEPPTVILKDDPVIPPKPLPRPDPGPIKLEKFLPTVWDDPLKQPVEVPVTPTIASPSDNSDPHPTGNVVAQIGPAPVVHSGPQSVGAVCTKTLSPTMPATNWSGDAVFRVVAGTHAGRVSSVEIQAVSGGMDMRSQRAFKAAIESALREGYECASDVRFTQEFHFHVE